MARDLNMAESGYFNAYGNIVRKDNVDYVVHLGYYIYKSADGVVGKDDGPMSVAEKDALVYANNEDLQWTEQYDRGYLEFHIRPDDVLELERA